jgi:hypothetical protein
MDVAPALRPADDSLLKLKAAMIEAYVKSQEFLSFAIRLAKQGSKLVAIIRIEDSHEHGKSLAESEQQVEQAAGNCESFRNLSARVEVKKLLEVTTAFSQTIQNNTYVINNEYRWG